MKISAEVLYKPKTVCLIVAFLCSCVIMQVHGQDACQSECVKDLYARNCGGASCITGVSSSQEFESLCGSACISAISGGGMLDCLIAIGGSTLVQNNFVLNVQSFCANGDPFVPNTRGVTTVLGRLTTVESSPSPIDPEHKPSTPSSHASASVTAPPESSASVESVEVEPSMEDAPESTMQVDPPISTSPPDSAEPSVAPPSVDSLTPVSEILEVEPPSSEEAITAVPMYTTVAPSSGVGVESRGTNSKGPVFEIGPESVPAPSKEPYSATTISEEPMTSSDSAPASEPSIPPSEPSVSLPSTEGDSSLPEFDPDDYILENDSLKIIEESFNPLDPDDED